jgi:Type IV secretion system pilin
MSARSAKFAWPLVAVLFSVPLITHASLPFWGPIIPDAYNVCAGNWNLVMEVINRIIQLALTIAIMIVAPIMLTWAGILILTSGGNPGARTKAKDMLLSTVVGITVSLSAWLIVNALMAVLYKPANFTEAWYELITADESAVKCIPLKASLDQSPGGTAVRGVDGSGTPITDVPDGTMGASGLNISSAVAYLNANARSTSQGQCALYVRQALAAGGLTSFDTNHPGSAYQYGPYLINAGFTTVSSSGYVPLQGDVIVFANMASRPNGHIQMYNGSQWVSDFRQNSMYPAQDYRSGSYTIYRP